MTDSQDETKDFIVVSSDAPAAITGGSEQTPPQEQAPDGEAKAAGDETTTPPDEKAGDDSNATDDAAEPKQRPKRSAQKRINKAIAREKQAQAEAEQLRQQMESLRIELDALKQPAPVQDDFEDYDDFVRAKDAHAQKQSDAKKALEDAKQKSEQASTTVDVQVAVSTIQAAVNAAEDLPNDFEEKVYSEDAVFTDDMLKSISATDDPTKLLYILADDRDKAKSIAEMDPVEQARAIFKMEFEASRVVPKPPTHSNAPEPIKPVNSGSEPTRKAVADMSFAEYEQYMNEKGANQRIF